MAEEKSLIKYSSAPPEGPTIALTRELDPSMVYIYGQVMRGRGELGGAVEGIYFHLKLTDEDRTTRVELADVDEVWLVFDFPETTH